MADDLNARIEKALSMGDELAARDLEEGARLGDEVAKAQGGYSAPSASRSLSFDTRDRFAYSLQKGVRKPGRISYDVLRRAVNAVHIARICVNVLKERVTKTPWAIQPIDPLKKVDEAKVRQITEFFRHPNLTNETFRTLLDKMLEDLLVLDAVTLEKTRYPDGTLAELHYVDAATIRPVFDEHGNQDIPIPIPTEDTEGQMGELPVSYIQVMNNSQYGGPESGEIVAAWPKKDFIYFNMHPQGMMEGFGYGLSPLEAVMSVVANILNADNYNGTYFEEGAFPPILLQFLQNMDERALQKYREYLFQELSGRFHRPAVIAGEKEIKVQNLKANNNRDMEFMEYMKFLARLMAAAYGLSAQDIGLTEDMNYATSQVQKTLSESKGYGSILHLIKEVFNQEIIWKDFGATELEFTWNPEDTTDPKDKATLHDTSLKNGSLTLNEVRAKMGEAPFGKWADRPMILTATGYVPILATAGQDADEDDEDKKEDLEPDKPGGEDPYEEQDEEDIGDPGEVTGTEKKQKPYRGRVRKSIYTDNGYKTWQDDRGYGQPFIFVNILNGKGFSIKPPIAVNLDSQKLEEDLSNELANMGLNVPRVTRMTEKQVRNSILMADPMLELEFTKYQNMTPEYDSEKWRAKFGGSRKFPYYMVSSFIDGRNLRDPLLLDDMKRDPEAYAEAIRDLANLWKVEKEMVLGDRRADQYIITPDKRAWGIDYQFKGDQDRYDGTKDAIQKVLQGIPTLRDKFLAASLDGAKKGGGFMKVWRELIRKSSFGAPKETAQGLEDAPAFFGELFPPGSRRTAVKALFTGNNPMYPARHGFREHGFTYDFNNAVKALKEYVIKKPDSCGGVITSKDTRGVKYVIMVKDAKKLQGVNRGLNERYA